jgi:translation initiation factor 3 subunit E
LFSRQEAHATASDAMAEYDLLSTMTQYLDPQLVFALLEFVRARGIYKETDVLRTQIEVLKATNMVEFTIELYNALHGTENPPKQLEERREAVIQRMTELEEKAKGIIDVISNEKIMQDLRADRKLNSKYLEVRLTYRSASLLSE